MSDAFIAIDWGTTNRRVYVIDGGQVAHTDRDDCGALQVSDFAGELTKIRRRLGELPVLMAGMVGSTAGWRTVPYVAAPAGLQELAAHLSFIDPYTAIVPGLSVIDEAGRCDVMRGEEIQILGAAESGLVPPEAVVCQPGTHCKWVWIEGGRISRFVTAMTGELFALLRTHSLLATTIQAGVENLEAFREGLEYGQRRDLAASLFSVRAETLLGRRPQGDAASFVSGVLIGADVAARLEEVGSREVHVLADERIGELYITAIHELGGTARLFDSHTAFVAGISAIRIRAQ